MPPAIVYFESEAEHQEARRDAMRNRTTETRQQEYPETEITATVPTDRRASCHSKHIPESRPEMIAGFPNRLTSESHRRQTQARLHAISDHEQKMANRAVDLTTGKRAVFDWERV